MAPSCSHAIPRNSKIKNISGTNNLGTLSINTTAASQNLFLFGTGSITTNIFTGGNFNLGTSELALLGGLTLNVDSQNNGFNVKTLTLSSANGSYDYAQGAATVNWNASGKTVGTIQFDVQGGGTAIFNMQGGSLTNYGGIAMGSTSHGNDNSTSYLNVTNGVLSITNGQNLTMSPVITLGTPGAKLYSFLTVTNTGVLVIPTGAGFQAGNRNIAGDTFPTVSQATISLGGGTLQLAVPVARQTVTATTGAGSAQVQFYFNGGTLQALANLPQVFTGFGTVNSTNDGVFVMAGGAVINNNSFNVGISNNLVAATNGSLGGGLTTLGSGILSLSGSNNFTGPTYVAGGTLIISNQYALQNSTLNYTNGTVLFGSNVTAYTVGGLAGTVNLGLTNGAGTAIALTVGGSNSTATNNAVTTYGGVLTGAGTLTLQSGALSLTNNNTYTNTTAVNGGELIGVTGGSCSNSIITVAAGATNGVLLATSGGQWVCTNLINQAGGYVDINFSTNAPSTSVAPVLVLGNLSVSNTATIGIIIREAVDFPAGLYPLIKYNGALSGTPPTSATIPVGMSAVITNDSAHNLISLLVTKGVGLDALTWAGGSAAWDNTTANWTNNTTSGALVSYLDGDAVTFDDSSTGTSPLTVSVSSTLYPGSIAANTTNNSYIISGSGALTVTAGLTKTGTGTLTLANTGGDTFTSGLAVNGGAVILDNSSGTIAGKAVIGAAGLLQVGNNDANGSLPTGNLTNNGALVFNRSDTALNVAQVINGSGSLTNIGSGTVTLSGANTYSGNTYINNGTVSVSGAGNSIPTGSTVVLGSAGNPGMLQLITNQTLAGLTNIGLAGKVVGGSAVNVTNTLNIGGTATNIFGGSFGGPGANQNNLALVKSGTGTLVLTGTNTFYGGVVLTGNGTLQIGNGGTAGTLGGTPYGVALVSGGVGNTVAFNRTDTTSSPYAVTNPISGGAKIVVNSGAVLLSGTNDNASASVDVKTGVTLIFAKNSTGNAHCIGGNSVIENGGTLQLGTTGTGGDQIYYNISVTNYGTFDLNGMSEGVATLYLSGTGVSGVGALINNNSGTTSTFTNSVVAGAGIILLTNSSLGGAGNLTLPTLPYTLISGGFAITKVGAGTLTLGGTNTYTGGTTNSAGTISVGVTSNLGTSAAPLVFDGGTLQITGTVLNNFSTIGHTVSFNAGKNVGLDINNAANTFTADQALNQTTGGLTKLGVGTLVLNQPNTYSGNTFIGAGKLVLGIANGIPTNSLITLGTNGSAATLDLAGFNQQVTNLTIAVGATASSQTITNSSASSNPTLQFSGGTSTFGGIIKDGATRNVSLTVASGSLTLTNANTYTGGTTISGGTLALGAGGSLASTNIVVGSGATYDVSAAPAYTLGGSQTLQGLGTVNGSVTNASASSLYPGTHGGSVTPGILTITNNLTLLSGANCTVDLSTTYNGINGQIVVGNNLTLNNNNMYVAAPATLDTNNDYLLITNSGTLAGSFSTTPIWVGTPPANSSKYTVVTANNAVTLHYDSNQHLLATAAVTPAIGLHETALLTVNITQATSGGSPVALTSVNVDLTSIGGTTGMTLYDDGTYGDQTNADNVYSLTIAPLTSTTTGIKTLSWSVTDSLGSNVTGSVTLTITNGVVVWNGGSPADNNWSSSSNWNGAFPALTGDGLLFAGTTRLTPALDYTLSVTSLNFDPTAGAFTLGTSGGNYLTLSTAGTVANNSANTQTVNLPLSLGAAQTFSATSNNFVFGGYITNGGTLVTVSGSSNTTFNAAISGTGGLTKTNSGTATLGAANTYSGGTTIGAGTLALSGGTDRILNSSTVTFSGVATLDLGGNSQTLTNVSFGSLPSGTATVTNGNLTVTTTSGLNLSSPFWAPSATTVDLSGLNTFTYNQPSQNFTFNGQPTNSSTLKLAGTNHITANAINIVSGGLGNNNATPAVILLGQSNLINTASIQSGGYKTESSSIAFNSGLNSPTLTLRGTNGVAAVGTFTIGFNNNGFSFVHSFDATAGSIDAIVSNLYVLNYNSGGTEQGTMSISNGTFNVGTVYLDYANGGANTTGTATFNQNGGTVLAGNLGFNASATTGGPIVTSTYNLGNGTTVAGLLSANIISIGALPTTNSTSSRATLNFTNGTIENYDPALGQPGSAGAATGSFATATNLTLSGLAGGGAVTNDYRTLNIVLAAAGTHNFNAESGYSITEQSTALISGSGGLTANGAGTLVLSNANTYTGGTTVSGGTLEADNNKALGTGLLTLGGGTLSNNVSSTLTNYVNLSSAATVGVGASQTLTLGGIITNTGALTKAGSGTLILTNANTYTGNTTISGGTLALSSSGSLHNTPQISIAAGATFDVSAISTYTLTSSNTLNASGTASAATIKGASAGTVNLGNQPVVLTDDGNTTHPALTISQGVLVLGDNSFTVNSASPLASGIYHIVTTAGSITAGGTIALNVASTAIDSTHYGTLSISGTDVLLTVALKPTVTGITYSRAPGVGLKIYASDLTNTATVDTSLGYSATFDHCDATTANVVTLGVSGSGNSAIIVYPSNATNLSDSFSYTITDGHGATASGTVTITINNNVTGQQASISLAGGSPAVSFFGVPGYHYVVQRSVDGLTSWADLTTVATTDVVPSGTSVDGNGVITAPAGGAFTVTDSSPPVGPTSVFYQLKAAP